VSYSFFHVKVKKGYWYIIKTIGASALFIIIFVELIIAKESDRWNFVDL
jgi:hypothetical protein